MKFSTLMSRSKTVTAIFAITSLSTSLSFAALTSPIKRETSKKPQAPWVLVEDVKAETIKRAILEAYTKQTDAGSLDCKGFTYFNDQLYVVFYMPTDNMSYFLGHSADKDSVGIETYINTSSSQPILKFFRDLPAGTDGTVQANDIESVEIDIKTSLDYRELLDISGGHFSTVYEIVSENTGTIIDPNFEQVTRIKSKKDHLIKCRFANLIKK